MVKITVPATTANLGPGFDCLGLALCLYNEVSLTVTTEPGLHIQISGEGADYLPTDKTNLVYRAAAAVFTQFNQHPAGLVIHQENQIPISSGLGSSAAATLAGVLGANALLGDPLTLPQLLSIASRLEGHPDNVAPALYGGLALSLPSRDGPIVETMLVPPQKVVIILPDFALSTTEARLVLPATVPLRDAVFNASRLPLVIQALQNNDYVKLSLAMQDRMHQPYRLPLIPGAEAAGAAALAAGAAAVVLSGAGPSLAAFSINRHEAIAAASQSAFAAAGLNSRHWVLSVDINGSRVINSTDPVN